MAIVTVAADEAALERAAAQRIATLVAEAIATHGSAVVSLTGGRTARGLYTRLADPGEPWRARIDWVRVHLFWGDERHVPPDHPDSNFGMANDSLLAHVPIPAGQVHRMRGELADANEAAAEYAQTLADGFAAAGRHDRTFDLMLLGLGEDAHIASLFPGRDYRREAAPAMAVWAAHLGAWRITLTPRALLDARAIVMVVGGDKKADAVREAIEGAVDVARFPAQVLREAGDRVEWMLDKAAASKVSPRAGSRED
jgi:6-phosphogluconolactonase